MEENDEYTSFMEFCKNLEGKTLKTLGGNAYFEIVQVKPNQLEYKISIGNSGTKHKKIGRETSWKVYRYQFLQACRL